MMIRYPIATERVVRGAFISNSAKPTAFNLKIQVPVDAALFMAHKETMNGINAEARIFIISGVIICKL